MRCSLNSRGVVGSLKGMRGKHFVINGTSCSAIILPPVVRALGGPAFGLLRRFMRRNKRVVAFSTPAQVSKTIGSRLTKLLANAAIASLPRLSGSMVTQCFSSSGFEVAFGDNGLCRRHHQFTSKRLIFLIGSSVSRIISNALSARKGTVLRVSTLGKRVCACPSSGRGNVLDASFQVRPTKDLLLCYSSGGPGGCPRHPKGTKDDPIATADQAAIDHLHSGTLAVSFYSIAIGKGACGGRRFSHTTSVTFGTRKFAGNGP